MRARAARKRRAGQTRGPIRFAAYFGFVKSLEHHDAAFADLKPGFDAAAAVMAAILTLANYLVRHLRDAILYRKDRKTPPFLLIGIGLLIWPISRRYFSGVAPQLDDFRFYGGKRRPRVEYPWLIARTEENRDAPV